MADDPVIATPTAENAIPEQARPLSMKRRLFGWLFRIADYTRRFFLASVDHRLHEVQVSLAAIEQQLVEQAQRELSLERELASARADLVQVRAVAMMARDNSGALIGLVGPRFDELEIKIRPLITFDEDSYAVRLADGYAMLPRSEPTFATMVVNAPSGGLEAGTRRVLRALIEPGMIVGDVGANVGLLTLACARATGPSGRVHAFEPEPGARRQLEKTVALNGLSWVEIHPVAAGGEPGTLQFNVSPIIGHSSLYRLPDSETHLGRGIDVQVVRLDDIVSPGTPFDVVKIDVEGAELDVLAGMSAHIAANPRIAIIAEFGPSHLERLAVSPQAWWDAFASYGFAAFGIEEPTGVCKPITLERALGQESINLVFLRPDSGLTVRLPTSGAA